MEIRPGMSREEEDAAMEERALAAIEARLQRLAGEYDSHYKKKKEGSPTKRIVNTAATRRLRESSPPSGSMERAPEPEPEQALSPPEFDQYSDVPSTPPTDELEAMGVSSIDTSAATVEAAATALDLEMQVEELQDEDAEATMAPSSPVLLPSRTAAAEGARPPIVQTSGGEGEGLGWLGRWGLSSIASSLETLGVETQGDLKFLSDDEIAELSLKPVTARKLRAAMESL